MPKPTRPVKPAYHFYIPYGTLLGYLLFANVMDYLLGFDIEHHWGAIVLLCTLLGHAYVKIEKLKQISTLLSLSCYNNMLDRMNNAPEELRREFLKDIGRVKKDEKEIN